MKVFSRSLAIMLAAAFPIWCVAAPPAATAAREPVEVKLEAKKVTAVNGAETFAPATTAKPGDIIEYVVTYSNSGAAPVTNVVGTLPIPAGMELIPESMSGAGVQASLDGVNFSPMPLKRVMKRPDGTTVEQLVPVREYRAVRWPPSRVEAKKSLSLSARARMISDLK